MAYTALPAGSKIEDGKIIIPIGNVDATLKVRVKAGTSRPAGTATSGVFTAKSNKPVTLINFPFNESSGNIAIDTETDKAAAVNGGTWTGEGYELNGTDGSISLVDAIAKITNSGSVLLKFKPTVNFPVVGDRRIFRIGDSVEPYNILTAYIPNGTTFIRLVLYKDGEMLFYDSPGLNLVAGTSCTFALTWNYYLASLIFNGVRKLENRMKIPSAGGDLMIGANLTSGDTQTLPAVIEKFTVIDRELSPDGVNAWSNEVALVPKTQFDKLNPQQGTVILRPTEAWEGDYVAEARLHYVPGEYPYKLLYTSGVAPYDKATLGLAVSKNIIGPYIKRAAPVIGGNIGGASGRAVAGHDTVFKDGFWWCFATDGYQVSQTGHGYLYKSADLENWSYVGKFLDRSAHTEITHSFGNWNIITELQPDGYYYGLAEAFTTAGIWEMFLIRTQDFAGIWGIVQKLPSLSVFKGGAVGGASVRKHKDTGVWMCWYHFGGFFKGPGNLPTRLAYAESTDLRNWIIKEVPVMGVQDKPEDWGDNQQWADHDVYEEQAQTAFIGTYNDNQEIVKGELRLWHYPGTKEQLTEGLQPVILPRYHVKDSFNRPFAPLGNAEEGGAWLQKGGSTINTNGNWAEGTGEGRVMINTGVTDNIDISLAFVQIPNPANATTNEYLYVLFCTTEGNTGGSYFQPAMGVLGNNGQTTTHAPYVNGDILKISIRGNEMQLYKNGSVNGLKRAIAHRSADKSWFGVYVANNQPKIDWIEIEPNNSPI